MNVKCRNCGTVNHPIDPPASDYRCVKCTEWLYDDDKEDDNG